MDNFDDKYKKKNPFSVPDGYFDDLSGRVMDNIANREKKPAKEVIRPRAKYLQMLKPYLGLVGIFLLALFIVQFFFPLVIDEGQLERKENAPIVQNQETEQEEIIFDSQFNPTKEEIIEYLALEADTDELFYAKLY